MLNALRDEPIKPANPEDTPVPSNPEISILPLSVESLGLVKNGRCLLDGISFQLDQGPISVILGANGAGKTLLLKTCHGLLQPSRGRISWHDMDWNRIRKSQAMVFQRSVLLKRSVAANIDYALKLRGVTRKERIERVEQSLALANLNPFRDRHTRTLSGGEQQKLALARAWAVRPEVLFMDEPTANIDPPATAAIEALIRDFANRGVKIVMTTHDLHQARRLADEILFLDRGRLLEQTPAEIFFEHPASRAADAFIHGELSG